MTVILSEASFADQNTTNGRELIQLAETARMLGCRVYNIPPNFDLCETAENALAYLPHFDSAVAGLWIGYIPSPERYVAFYEAALAKGVRLVNSPDQHQTAMEFNRFYPLLAELTPKSVVVDDVNDLASIGASLGYPVFVKGAVKSDKEAGWQACVATTHDELTAIAARLLTRKNLSRGRIIVRKLARLRALESGYQDFPLGREYRVFVLRGEVLALGFYWDESGPMTELRPDEEQAVRHLALESARRVGAPFVAVDVGQLETGGWIVIEVGDGQFSGLSHVPPLQLWGRLVDLIEPEHQD